MSKITLIPLNQNEADHPLTVPDGEEWYYALRCRSLLNGQLAGVMFSAPSANNLPLLGQINVNDETARQTLISRYAKGHC